MGILGDHILDTQFSACKGERFSISIGGICCSIICQDASFLDMLRVRYQWFESSGPPTYEIVARVVTFEELASEARKQTIQPTVKKVNAGDNYILRRGDNPFLGVVNTRSRKSLVKLWNSPYCFDSYLRMLYTLALVDAGGLLLHASAISESGRGNVFFGPSGSGKTTVARLSANRLILTDELVLIKPHNGAYRVYGTPFWGEFTPGRSNARAELTGLYSLKKDRRNYLVTMDSVQAVNELYQCVLFFSDEHELLSRILETCCNLVDKVPVRELHFLPDPSFWAVVNPDGENPVYA